MMLGSDMIGGCLDGQDDQGEWNLKFSRDGRIIGTKDKMGASARFPVSVFSAYA